MCAMTLDWTVEHAKPVRFDTIGFDPTMDLKFRCDKFDLGGLVDEKSLGILASPNAASAQVLIILGEYRKVCASRQLAIHSLYFRRHLCVYPSPHTLYIPPMVTIEGLDAVLNYIEADGIDVTIWNVGSILCAAARLRFRDLQRRLEQYLRAASKLNDSYMLQCWEMCRRAPASVQIREEMLVRASERFLYLPEQPEWCQINSNLVRRLLMRPEVKSLAPMALFDAALTWITGNPNGDLADVDRVLSAVPFTRMSKIERMQCLSRAAEIQLTSTVLPRIAQAAWHQTCLDFDHPSQSDLPVSEAAPALTETDRAERAIIMSFDDGTNVADSAATESQFDDAVKGNEAGFGTNELEEKRNEPAIASGKTSQAVKTPESDQKKKTGDKTSGRESKVEINEVMKILPDGRRLKYTDEKIFKRRNA